MARLSVLSQREAKEWGSGCMSRTRIAISKRNRTQDTEPEGLLRSTLITGWKKERMQRAVIAQEARTKSRSLLKISTVVVVVVMVMAKSIVIEEDGADLEVARARGAREESWKKPMSGTGMLKHHLT
jgi:hypothetical protein